MGWSTWVITSRASIFARCSLTLGYNAIGHFLGAWMTGWASGCSHILYLPRNLPIPVNLPGKSLVKSSVELMHLDFGVLAVGGFSTLAAWVGAAPVRLLLAWVNMTQLTSHMLGDPREQDQVCLQCTSMSGSCVVGLQECLVARGWGHGGFHTEESETHCKWLAWFEWVQAKGQAIWAGLFWMQLLEQMEGVALCYVLPLCIFGLYLSAASISVVLLSSNSNW